MKNPSVRSRLGSSCRCGPGPRPRASRRQLLGEVRRRRIRGARAGTAHPISPSSPRDRADRVDQRPAGRDVRRSRGQDRALHRRRAHRSPRELPASADRDATAGFPGRCRADRPGPGQSRRRRRRGSTAPRRPPRRSRSSRASARRFAAARRRVRGGARPRPPRLGPRAARRCASSCRRVRRTGRARARRRRAPSTRATSIEPRDCGMIAPRCQRSEPWASNAGLDDQALGQPRRGV